MRNKKKNCNCQSGFTVIELIMVLVFLGIVAVIAIPYALKSTTSANTGSVAKKVKDDIRYAQSLAMARNKLETPATVNDPKFTYRIVFNLNLPNCPGTNNYAIVSDADNNGTWGENPNALGVIESAKNPSDGSKFFCIQFGTGSYQGFNVSANFGGTAPSNNILEFDTNGIPYNGSVPKTKITAPNNVVTITNGAETVTLTVTPNTGLVVQM